MSRCIWSFLLTFFFLIPAAHAATFTGAVVNVSDGDTVTLLTNQGKERLRLLGIDTPEKAQIPWGPRAKDFISRLVLNKSVRVETDVQARDRYGRMLGYLYVGNLFVNLEMVRQGYAMLYTCPPNVAHTEALVAAQKEARAKGLNIWAPNGGLSQTPYEFRHNGKAAPPERGQNGLRARKKNAETIQVQRSTGDWVGSSKAKKFHRADCPWAEKISEQNRVYFQSPEEARQSGFKPCRSCGK